MSKDGKVYLAYSFRISSVHPYALFTQQKKKTEKKLRPKNKWLKANCIHFKYSRFWPKDINNKRTKGIKSAIFLSLAFLPPFFLYLFFLAGNYLLFHLRLRLQIIIRLNGHCYCFFYGRLMPRNRTVTAQPPSHPPPPFHHHRPKALSKIKM